MLPISPSQLFGPCVVAVLAGKSHENNRQPRELERNKGSKKPQGSQTKEKNVNNKRFVCVDRSIEIVRLDWCVKRRLRPCLVPGIEWYPLAMGVGPCFVFLEYLRYFVSLHLY